MDKPQLKGTWPMLVMLVGGLMILSMSFSFCSTWIAHAYVAPIGPSSGHWSEKPG